MPKVPRRQLGLIAALCLVCVALLWWLVRSGAPPAPAAAVPVRVAAVTERDLPTLIRAVGTVRSQRSVEVRSQVDGQLVELLVKEGQLVREGQLLARIDDRAIAAALAQAQAQLAVTEAQLKVAAADLERYRALRQDDAISAQVLDQQQALVGQLRATLRQQGAAVAAAEVQLSYTRIVSPTDGRVGIRNVDEGSFVRAADATGLFSVIRLDPIDVEVALPQTLLPTLRALVAAPTPAPVRVYAGEGGPLLGEGRLTLIDNQVATGSGTVRVKAEFANPEGKLWPNQSVAAALQAGLLSAARVVPELAVQRGIDGHFVYRLRGNKVELVPVERRYADGGLVAVTGVEPGDRVVVDGQSRLRDGVGVEVADDAAAAGDPAAGDPVAQGAAP